MSKSQLKSKLLQLNDFQQREVELYKKEVAEKLKPFRDDINAKCKANHHRYDNGESAVYWNNNNRLYCRICGQVINEDR